jgi:hypothetical protein
VTTSAAVAEIDFASTVRVVKLSEGDGTCTTLAEGASGAVYVGGLTVAASGEDVTLRPGNGLMLDISSAGTAPAPDGNMLHVWDGTAGSFACTAADTVCLESNVTNYLRMAAGTTSFAGMVFGTSGRTSAGGIVYGFYNNATDPEQFRISVGPNTRIQDWGVGVHEYKQATTISSLVGSLTFDAAANHIFASPIALTPPGDQSLSNDGTINCANGSLVRVVGNGGPVTLSTTSVGSAVSDGQQCIIQGTDDTNHVTINDNTNVQLDGGVGFQLDKGHTLTLIWDTGDGDWYETRRSAP